MKNRKKKTTAETAQKVSPDVSAETTAEGKEPEKSGEQDTNSGETEIKTQEKETEAQKEETESRKEEAEAQKEETESRKEVAEAQKEEAGTQKKDVEDEKTTPLKRKGGKARYIVVAAVCVVLAGLIGVYCRVANYYSTRFFPGTVLNGEDCSKLSVAEAFERLSGHTRSYSLDVWGRNPGNANEQELLATITAEQINMQAVGLEQGVQTVMDAQNKWLWPGYLWTATYTNVIETTPAFDEERLKGLLRESAWYQRANMEEPQDAYIAGYSEEAQCFVIVPDTPGTRLDIQLTRAAIEEALYAQEESVDLDACDCYRTAKVTADNEKLLDNLAEANQWLGTEITYDWNGTRVVLDREQLKDWISIEHNTASLDRKAVAEFVAENAKENDTYGKKRNFVTTAGSEITLASGAYGWKTDRNGETEELLQLIYQGRVTDREPIYVSQGAQKGSNDIGSSYVEADLSNQHLYLYQNGQIVMETDFVSGNVSNGNTTPPGVFGITYKTMDAVLRGDNYATPVKYWMPFNGNIGMHDATWRSSFGGDIYLTSGSHGCINLPYSAAKEIYQYVSTGFPVICYY